MYKNSANWRLAALRWVRAWLLSRFGPRFEQLLEDRKRQLFSNTQGTVVEVGPGMGSNLRYLPSEVYWVGVEPNRFMHKHLFSALKRTGVRGGIVGGCAESIPVETGGADVVISTLVLCSVADPAQTLAEIQRVLKPEGQFVFIEHIAAQHGSWQRTLQRIARPLWRVIGDGCCPDREIDAMIERAGFRVTGCDNFMLHGASFVTPRHIAGRAVKSAPTMGDVQKTTKRFRSPQERREGWPDRAFV